ncbi:hypothetical protein CDD82_298 [Ophiocordyceps australis]|uniref:SEC7 domain-containing protein n=1 Tax=Ophiocordyceps australis TaxID=1399860 RepID=A0A2C5XDT2_9HYPO|nr:hypothetical protein CDD82_298 [Ophiocordyceps australis]
MPFFKLRKSKKSTQPLFPLAHLPQQQRPVHASCSTSSLRPASGPDMTPRPCSAQSVKTPRPPQDKTLAAPTHGTLSARSSPTHSNLIRGRSSTMSSAGRDSSDGHHPIPPSHHVLATTTGRKSFSDLFGLGRVRHHSDHSHQGSLTPATPASLTSKSNSLQLSRSSLVLPERADDESPAKYLARLDDLVSRHVIASALSRGSDSFSTAVLRSYMRSFSFFGDPMDMALRKLLMEAELPKETQQIDRCLQAFANRYHECNPGIYSCPDQAYFIAFSLLILHTDVFNKNNKHKMQKTDYLKNTRGEGIFDEILECFYDNISYTPFIHVDDEDGDASQDRLDTTKPRKKKSNNKKQQQQQQQQLLSATSTMDPAKRAVKETIDPYTLILDGNLDVLRPNLKDAMHIDDHYNYWGTSAGLNLGDLQKTFFKTGILQIVSARSRPDAFLTEQTATNPQDAHPGIVDIKITKVGLLWRKETKKRKTRSPWHEWGAILTGAQLYFFRNTSWVKDLMHQHENHIKAGNDGIPVIFKPPLETFKPDALISTQGAVALLDLSYKKHKNAFVFVGQGGLEEVLLADNEDERNDWLAKLNYAAAFRTSGVRMRGVVGGHYDGQGRRGIRRLDSSDGTQLVQTPTGPVSIVRGRIDHKMAQDIQTARRHGMQEKIAEADRKVDEVQRQLDEQLRNARHLQILAPVQPRSRDQLLLAAARISAQLKWTRMEIWREKCHRDILLHDLAEDGAGPVPQTRSQADSDGAGTPPTHTHLHGAPGQPKSRRQSAAGSASLMAAPSTPEIPMLLHSVSGPRKNSVSTLAASPVQSPASTRTRTRVDEATVDNDNDANDAIERSVLKQSGLWEAGSGGASLETLESADYADASERDKTDRNKVRRSLQRTLRDSASHASTHRGKAVRTSLGSCASAQDAMLDRGSGSFVVHGKKASVINLGTELQSLSQDEKLLSRKQLQQHNEQAPSSPVTSGEGEEDFQSAPETRSDGNYDSSDRRQSAASASTATALSFRELHRRYSSAQAARTASGGTRVVMPSDGESDVAVSCFDERTSSSLLPDMVQVRPATAGAVPTTRRRQRLGADQQVDSGDDESLQELDTLSRHHVQAVNA